MSSQVTPILPTHVDFAWVKDPEILEEDGHYRIVADAQINGRLYRVTYHFGTNKVNQQQAMLKLDELTDRIILLQTRYFYGDVVSLRYSGSNEEVQRTYESPERHDKKPSFTNQFATNFDKQLQVAQAKLTKLPANSEKHQQVQNRIERIKATKALYEYTRKRNAPLSNEEFTLESRAAHEAPKASKKYTPLHAKTRLPVEEGSSDAREQRYQEQEIDLEVAQEKFAQYQEEFDRLTQENEALRRRLEAEED